MAALQSSGFTPAAFKVGPDFIDPGYHGCITGTASRNLDGWMLTKTDNQAIFATGCAGADIAVVEGVMGLYDGYSGTDEAGSTAQMAKWLDLPVLLVVDARSMARSAAALVYGFTAFDPAVAFAGVVFNNLGSRHHYRYLKEALEHYTTTPVLGGILRDTLTPIPERHLGLVTHQDHGFTRQQSEKLAHVIASGLDVKRLVDRLPDFPQPHRSPLIQPSTPARGVTIAIAQDNAFCFYYPDNLDALKRAGAELRFFSPISDQCLPPEVDVIYLGGGYPEIHAEQLSRNHRLKTQILSLSQYGMPIYVRDVARVFEGPEEATQLVNFCAGPAAPIDEPSTVRAPAVTIAIAKKEGTNGVAVANEVLAKLESLKGRLIPDDV